MSAAVEKQTEQLPKSANLIRRAKKEGHRENTSISDKHSWKHMKGSLLVEMFILSSKNLIMMHRSFQKRRATNYDLFVI